MDIVIGSPTDEIDQREFEERFGVEETIEKVFASIKCWVMQRFAPLRRRLKRPGPAMARMISAWFPYRVQSCNQDEGLKFLQVP
jgi:hypothetical protein